MHCSIWRYATIEIFFWSWTFWHLICDAKHRALQSIVCDCMRIVCAFLCRQSRIMTCEQSKNCLCPEFVSNSISLLYKLSKDAYLQTVSAPENLQMSALNQRSDYELSTGNLFTWKCNCVLKIRPNLWLLKNKKTMNAYIFMVDTEFSSKTNDTKIHNSLILWNFHS